MMYFSFLCIQYISIFTRTLTICCCSSLLFQISEQLHFSQAVGEKRIKLQHVAAVAAAAAAAAAGFHEVPACRSCFLSQITTRR